MTGTPGTGKKSIAPLVAKALALDPVGLNDLAKRLGPKPRGEVDTGALRERIARSKAPPSVYFGHLLPYVFENGALSRVVVLRCEPAVLKERLSRRGYPPKKLVENVEAELIGVVSSDAFGVFGGQRAFDFDTTYSTPVEAASAITDVLKGSAPPPARIDWTVTYDSGAKLRLLLSGA